MPKWEDDSKAGRLSKRINFLKRVTKGSKSNILHALDMVMQEVPERERVRMGLILANVERHFQTIEYYLHGIDSIYELLKDYDPEYKLKHKPKKRKPKQQKGT